MMDIIFWILISICCFYLVRNYLAGSFYFMADMIIKNSMELVPRDYHYLIRMHYTCRNYYLFVLNPFWWRVSDIFKRKEVREEIRTYAKNLRSFK